MSLRSLLLAVAFVVLVNAQKDDHPPFIASAPAAVRDSFYAVLQANANRPEDQVNAAVDAWAAAQSPSIAAQYRAFKDQVEKYQMEEEAAHKAAVARFSPAAKQADQRLSQLAAQTGISFEQKQKSIQSFMESLPQSVRQEILSAMQSK